MQLVHDGASIQGTLSSNWTARGGHSRLWYRPTRRSCSPRRSVLTQSFAPMSGSISRPRMCPVAPFHSPTPRLYPQSLCVSMEQSASGRAMHSSAMPCGGTAEDQNRVIRNRQHEVSRMRKANKCSQLRFWRSRRDKDMERRGPLTWQPTLFLGA